MSNTTISFAQAKEIAEAGLIAKMVVSGVAEIVPSPKKVNGLK